MPTTLRLPFHRLVSLTFAVVLASTSLTAPLFAQPSVLIQKSTNGQDADFPPGPILTVGATVNWSYEVINPGSRALVNIMVTDDQGVTVTCPAATLAGGTSMVCTASGTVQLGQYANIGTVDAELTNGTPVSDSDPSHYFGQVGQAIQIEKATEGIDADAAPGPSLPVGSTVNWTYEVTNTGTDSLFGIDVTDDQGVTVTCPDTSLDPGESMTCTASGTVQLGQYDNLGFVSASLPTEDQVADSDPSHYYGQTLLLEKSTNGFDADFPPGPTLAPGAAITWTYDVTNPGPAAVSGLSVTDDQIGAVSCPQTTLSAGESITCTANGTAQPGLYENVGTATAQLPLGGTVTGTDPSHYFGNVLRLEKSTNGQDADTPPGPVLAVGDAVAWTYEVTNLGSETITGLSVTDDRGVTVTCPGTSLAAGASMTCTANGIATSGQYENLGTAEGTHPTQGLVSASDSSHYLGQDQILDFGDASGSFYFTPLAANGARHNLGSGVFLGTCVDSELDGQPSAGLDADDTTAGLSTFGTCAVADDDEDGVTFASPLLVGTSGDVDVVASAPCTLSAWIDFGRDGDWTDPGDDLFPGGVALAAGSNPLTFSVPATANPGTAAARFRCTTDGAVGFLGEASDGEVEDHAVVVAAPVVDVTATKEVAHLVDQDSDGLVEAGDTLLYTVTITNSGNVSATGVTYDDTPDPNTTLLSGSVTTSQGTVLTGNTGGDASVTVDVGTLAALGSVTITYQVTIVDPLPPGTTQVTNQGVVSGSDFPDVPTDDPNTPAPADPTSLAVSAPLGVAIPTASSWGLLALLVILAGLAVRRLAAAG